MKNYMFLFFILFVSCANIIPPGGGPKDLSPPMVISATPTNPSIHFQKNTIKLLFDEYIQIKNIKDIKISPQCMPDPEIILKGKMLSIKLNCPLEENTTYTINFGKSISDITEGNILTNFKYVFSTGDYLDSLFIKGIVKDLYFNESIEGVLVGLSNNLDSLNSYYYTFSNRDGSFALNNVKDAKYLLFAFLDKNNNFQYDSGELISMPETIQNLNVTKNLGLFYEARSQPITDIKSINKNTLLFEHDILKDSIIILNATGIWNVKERSSTFWFNKSPNIIKYQYQNFIDSIALTGQDSIERISLKLISELYQINKTKLINIETNIPIQDLDLENFSWELNADSIKARIINPFILQVPITPSFHNSQKLVINSNALIGINGQTNDSTSFHIEYNYAKYGSLKIKSEISDTNLIVELFDNNNIIRKTNIKDSVLIDWIPTGNYNLRVFADHNNNKHWDAGNILNRKMNEKIIVYPQTIKIKSNWEVDISISW